MKNKIKDLNDKLNDTNSNNLKLKNKNDISEIEIKNERSKVSQLENDLFTYKRKIDQVKFAHNDIKKS